MPNVAVRTRSCRRLKHCSPSQRKVRGVVRRLANGLYNSFNLQTPTVAKRKEIPMLPLCVGKPSVQPPERHRLLQTPYSGHIKFSKHTFQVKCPCNIWQVVRCGAEGTEGGFVAGCRLVTSVRMVLAMFSNPVVYPEGADTINSCIPYLWRVWVGMRGMYSPIMIKGWGTEMHKATPLILDLEMNFSPSGYFGT